MTIEFLTINEKYQHKEDYLKHINDMINVELSEGDTYNHLFEKLKKRFKNKPVELKAVEEWVDYNHRQQEDNSIFDTVLCEKGKCYAVFNLLN